MLTESIELNQLKPLQHAQNQSLSLITPTSNFPSFFKFTAQAPAEYKQLSSKQFDNKQIYLLRSYKQIYTSSLGTSSLAQAFIPQALWEASINGGKQLSYKQVSAGICPRANRHKHLPQRRNVISYPSPPGLPKSQGWLDPATILRVRFTS